MTDRIWDKTVLQKEADFSLSLSLKDIYEQKNPDGTDASVTLKVEGSSIGFSIAMLTMLNDDDGETIAEAMFVANADILGIELTDDITEEDERRIVDELEKNHSPFIDFSMNANGEYEDVPHTLKLTITAPSYLIGLRAFVAMTEKRKLNSLLASFMPEAEYENEY